MEHLPCIVATGAEGLPVTDLASSFVLWADPDSNGSLRPYGAGRFSQGPESYEEFLEEKKRRDREKRLRLESQEEVRDGSHEEAPRGGAEATPPRRTGPHQRHGLEGVDADGE